MERDRVAARVKRDHRRVGLELGGIVAIGVPDRRRSEHHEQLGRLVGEHRDGPKAVDEDGLAPLDAGGEAGEQLQRRRRAAVGVVGVEAEREGRIGQVGRIRAGGDVEHAAVVGLAHGPEQLRHRRHRPLAGRGSGQDRKPVLGHRGQPAGSRGGVLAHTIVLGGRQARGQTGVPVPDRARRPAAGRSGARLGRQPLGREAARVATLPVDRERPVVHAGLDDPRRREHLTALEQALTADRVPAVPARAQIA